MRKVLFWSFLILGLVVLVLIFLMRSLSYGISSSNFFGLFIGLIFTALSFVIGSFLIRNYFRSKRKIFLVLGFVLTFIIPGFYFYYLYQSTIIRPTCYMPVMTSLGQSASLIKYREKVKNNLPDDLISKINKET